VKSIRQRFRVEGVKFGYVCDAADFEECLVAGDFDLSAFAVGDGQHVVNGHRRLHADFSQAQGFV
jgi:hypothetical protein